MARIPKDLSLSQDIIAKITQQDYAQITKTIEEFLKTNLQKKGSAGVVFGLSGGVDSSVIATLTSRILKKESLALIMPDSQVSPESETSDALNLVDKIGIEYKLVDINPIINEYSKYLEPDNRATGNLRARVRASIIYYYANAKNYLALGSSDKSEWLLGYFTKFGDGAADLLPIVSLYKLQIRKLAEYLGVPQNIITKKSSPHLWKDHLAEEEIGMSYEEIDPMLYCMFDEKMSTKDTADALDTKKEDVEKIFKLYQNSEHKRKEADSIQ